MVRRQERDRTLVIENDLGDEVAHRLAPFPDIRALGLVVYTAEGFELFRRTPQPRFDGRTAFDLLATGEAARVLAALSTDHEGLGY